MAISGWLKCVTAAPLNVNVMAVVVRGPPATTIEPLVQPETLAAVAAVSMAV